MPEDATSISAKDVELNRQLLDAKLSPPPGFTRGVVSRATLIDVARSGGHRIVGITAPAGYGKSTLLTQWAATETRPVAWVSLDRFDDDPIVLLALLASAYGRIAPGVASLADDVRGSRGSPLGRAAPMVAAALRASNVPFVIMVDDLHQVRSAACHDVLSVVIAGIPPGSQFIAASRAEQPHLAQARASGDSMEITSTDLVLDPAGARKIFAAAHLSLTREEAIQIIERTEGWPVGVYLAAAITRDGGETAVSGDDRYIADYLYREALIQLPVDQQQFLRRTALLDRLTGQLCDAVLDSDHSQRILRELDASNVFLIPLDRRRQWYRYHDLFREFLQSELGRVEPTLIDKLHVRAAVWFEQHGSAELAIEQLLEVPGERERVTHLMTAATLAVYRSGRLATVQRWFVELGDEAIEAFPPLVVLAGWIAVLTGHETEAARWAEVAERASYDVAPDDGSASFDSARAMLRSFMCYAGPEQALADALFAVAAELTPSPWRDQALYLFGAAQLLAAETGPAARAFEEGSETAAAQGNADILILCESELALLAMDDGRWVEAAGHVESALRAIDETRVHDYVTAVLASAEAARLALHRGDLEDVRRHLTRAMRARSTCTYVMPVLAVKVRLQLAKVYWALNDNTTAHHLLREIEDVFIHRPELGVLSDQYRAFREVMSSSEHSRPNGGSPLTPAELRLLPYLQTHLTIREIGDRLYVSRNTVNSEVGSIYRKLGVSTRSGAVAEATQIGLLWP